MKYSYDEFFQERTKLCYFELWQKLLQCERECETLRKNLLRNPYFDIQRAFKVIDFRNKGSFTIEDLENALKREGHQEFNQL